MAKKLRKPSKAELANAVGELVGLEQGWAKRRLKLIQAMLSNPKASATELAKDVRIRRSTVFRLLSAWRSRGMTTILTFGRPRAISPEIGSELKSLFGSGHLRTAADAIQWLKDSHQIPASAQTIYLVCRQTGVVLRRKAPKQKTRPQQDPKLWTPKQISEIQQFIEESNGTAAAWEGCFPPGVRARIVLAAGISEQALNEEMRKNGSVPRRTINRWTKAFRMKGGASLKNRQGAVERTGLWKLFCEKCAKGEVKNLKEVQEFFSRNGLPLSQTRSYIYWRRWKNARSRT